MQNETEREIQVLRLKSQTDLHPMKTHVKVCNFLYFSEFQNLISNH